MGLCKEILLIFQECICSNSLDKSILCETIDIWKFRISSFFLLDSSHFYVIPQGVTLKVQETADS